MKITARDALMLAHDEARQRYPVEMASGSFDRQVELLMRTLNDLFP